jgi:hypothetical protein
VTDHSETGARPLVIAGIPVVTRLRAAAELAQRMVGEFAQQVPLYRTLPAEQLDGEITQITLANLRLFGRVLADRREPTAEEMSEITRFAAQRAEEGVPLDALLSAYHVGIRTGWELVLADAGPADVADLREATALVLKALQAITAAVAVAYSEQRQAVLDARRTARQELVSALLTGGDRAHLTGPAGVRPAARYTVLALGVAAHPDEAEPGVDARIARRRTLLRVRHELESFADALHSLGPDGGLVLLPGSVGADRLTGLTARLGRAAGTPVTTATAAPAAPDGVPDAAREAREVLEVALRFGRPPALYRLTDVLLDYQLTRPGAARAGLAALLDPLDGQGELLRTLRVHLAHDLNRRRTATELCVHPNTVDYRLRRIAALTGLDPARPTDLTHLSAALKARQSP